MFDGEPIAKALYRLQAKVSRGAYADRFRHGWWSAGYYEKPGYRRRQKRFFGAVARNRNSRLKVAADRPWLLPTIRLNR